MTKKLKTVFFLALISMVAFSFSVSAQENSISNAAKETNEKEETYQTVIEIEDWGAVVTEVIVELGKPVPKNAVTEDTFDVHVSRSDSNMPEQYSNLGDGYRTVTEAFVADKDGNAIENGRGKYAVLKMEIGPEISLGSALNYDWNQTGRNHWVDYQYTITQVKDIEINSGSISGLVIDTFGGETRKLVEDFSAGEGTYDDVTLTYADFSPEKDKQQNPLIIWLHGGGEGGTDPTIPLSANKAVNFITDDIQAYFDGAYVLVPQTPTRWMEGFEGSADGTSVYKEALMSLIDDYVTSNPDIDPNRVYIGGASNGGYMSLLMTRDYPDYFAASFPVAEGLSDDLISDADIENLAQTPTWFVHAKNDPTLNPNNNTIPTYNRLVEAGADVHISLFEDVHDTSGLYTEDDGSPYQYNGHWSWIYLYNNEAIAEINGVDTTIMEWMAAQSK
ncbi:prolyl oligopeptidase family serine peptidase [Salipaludibacillus sp. CF4.18]|uniref:prolyl oligopeptidase family serine peptidase n=1 Tax=Salipaludibacillus sp. CF4.18 TaxID=3373081 RepID=UPI003EE7115C